MNRNGPVGPAWRKPSPLGFGAAVDAVTNVAAPLLAGFSVAAIGVVGADSDKFRWPGPALFCLTLSALLFVTCVQFGFHARRHLYSYADLTAWWTEDELADTDRRRLLRDEQRHDFDLWNRWRGRAYVAYSGGLVVLWTGVALVLLPPGPGTASDTAFRWAASAVAACAAVGEVVWSAYEPVRRRLGRRRLLRGIT
ncbi:MULTISPECIES: hypothetical protein [Streptomyces]|uniref:hypothetical protein n=1 Tax=Streptomyces TaxID=1883 RepID=UPI0014091BF3|nr:MULTISPECIES: hypothetical protein [Streptomyces]MDH6226786.1 hypothetical protein [Streptomyces sp. MJP52]